MEGERENSCACSCLAIAGIIFKPSDEDLLEDYLRVKIEGMPLCCSHLVAEFNIYDDNLMPWEILKDDDYHWFIYSADPSSDTINKTIYHVFTKLNKKKNRVMRRCGRGSWTGQRSWFVKNVKGDDIGYNKLLTYYEDSDNKGKKEITYEGHGHWIMHEYSLLGIDNYYAVCKITKEVEKSLSSNKTAARKQDYYTHHQRLLSGKEVDLPVAADTNFRKNVEYTNIVLGDDGGLGGGDHNEQPLDECGADWDINGWKAELEGELGLDIEDDGASAEVGQELPILAVAADAPLEFPVGLGVHEDITMIENSQITNGSQHVLNFLDQCLDDYGVDWEKINGWTTELYKEFDGAEINDPNTIPAVVQKLPAVEGMNEPQQVQSVLSFQVEENDIAVVQTLPVAVCDKNEKKHESYKGLDGADNYDVIKISDDDSIQELPMVGAADNPPKMQPINCDDQAENNRASNNIPDDSNFLNYIAEMDGIVDVQQSPGVAWENHVGSTTINQIFNDVLNLELVEPALAVEPTNTNLAGLDVLPDLHINDILHLGAAEINQQIQ